MTTLSSRGKVTKKVIELVNKEVIKVMNCLGQSVLSKVREPINYCDRMSCLIGDSSTISPHCFNRNTSSVLNTY